MLVTDMASSLLFLGIYPATDNLTVPPEAANSPSSFAGSWCSLSPGGSLSKLDIHRIEGQSATGHYKYNGLPTQMDEAITGTIIDGVFRARIGNISWILSRKGSNLDGTAANNRTGVSYYMQLKPC